MNEIRLGISSHTPAPQRYGRPVEVGNRKTRDADIDGLPEKVETVLGDATRVFAQQGVGLGRPVAGDDVEGLVRGDLPGQRMEQVEQPHIDLLDFSGSMISQDVVDLFQGRRQQAARLAVLDGRGFHGVGVKER